MSNGSYPMHKADEPSLHGTLSTKPIHFTQQ